MMLNLKILHWVDSHYLLENFQGSKKIQIGMVSFLNQQNKLAWECYLLGFNSESGNTGYIEVTHVGDIPNIDVVKFVKVKP